MDSAIGKELGKIRADETVVASGHLFYFRPEVMHYIGIDFDPRPRYRGTVHPMPANVAHPEYLAAFSEIRILPNSTKQPYLPGPQNSWCDARVELLIQLLSPCFQPPDELFFSWQGEPVFSRQHLVSQIAQRVVSDSRVVFRAED